MHAFPPETSHKLARAVERMPAFPRSVQKILELTRDVNCAPKELVAVIEKDPVLTVKILKVLNSAYYTLPSKVASIDRAVVYLGLNTVKNLAVSFAALGMLPRSNAAGFDIEQYLRHSLLTAGIARRLAAKYAAAEIEPMDCYIAGLLHDFGKVVFAQLLASEFRRALQASASAGLSLHQAERETIGADHALMGALLVERWQFPQQLVDCVRLHHEIPVPATVIAECVFLADTISKMLVQGAAQPPPGYAAQWRGQRIPVTVAEAVAALGDLAGLADEVDAFMQAVGQ